MKNILFIIYIICSVSGVLFMKYGGIAENTTSFFIAGIKLNVFTLTGIFLYGVGFFLWMFLVQKFELTKLLPFVMATFNTMTILFSVLIFGERLTFIKCIGVGLIIIGVIIVNI